MIEFRPIHDLPLDVLAPLLAASTDEGFRFIERLEIEWASGVLRYAGPGEMLLGGYADGQLIAVGGLTPDPYGREPGVGRLRRLYILPAWRGQGIGRRLVGQLEVAAAGRYHELVLRTDTIAAARFYEALGYVPIANSETATHKRSLVVW